MFKPIKIPIVIFSILIMSRLFLFATILSVTAASLEENCVDLFNSFKVKAKRNYATPEEEASR